MAHVRLAEFSPSAFIPTPPNPTSGFLIYVPEEQLIRLDLSVADAIKSIISLGSVAPEYTLKDVKSPKRG